MSGPAFKRPAFLVAVALLLVSAAALSAAVSGLKLQLRKLPIEVDRKVHTIPTDTSRSADSARPTDPARPTDSKHLDGWKQVGRDETMSKEIVDELGTPNYVSRVYERVSPMPDGVRPALQLHLAYYTGMVDTVPHVPDRCMVGGGWEIKSTPGVIPLPMDTSRWIADVQASDAKRTVYTGRTLTGIYPHLPFGIERPTLKVTEFELPSTHANNQSGANRRMLSGYFFIANGGMCAAADDVRLLAFDLTSRYAFYLKVQVSSVSQIDSPEKFAEYAADLLSDLLPDIMLCVPDWIDVERGDYPPEAAAAKVAAAERAAISAPGN